MRATLLNLRPPNQRTSEFRIIYTTHNAENLKFQKPIQQLTSKLTPS